MISGRYRLRSDIVTRTVRIDREGDTELFAECSICLYERPVYEATATGEPVCLACWEDTHSEQCTFCGAPMSDDRAKASVACEDCAEIADDADMTNQERGGR